MRPSRYDVLFEPIRIGPKVLKNRFVQVPHCCNFGTDFPYSQAALRATKAEGGWALVNTEYCSISPESDDYPRSFARLWDDDDIRNLSVLCDQVHEHDALAGVELWYGSFEAGNWETRQAARGVSAGYDDEAFTQGAFEMSGAEIRELRQMYVEAARRARAAGFDVINVYAGHFHTIAHQFMSPYYNKRTDEYGGSLENRTRFMREVLEVVRDAVGGSCAVGVRFGFESQRGDAGFTAHEEGVQVISLLDDLVDFWDLQVGTHSNWNVDSAPSRTHAEGFNSPWMKLVRPYTKKPIIGVGRYVSPDRMLEAVRVGEIDIVGAARPSIADPFLPRKIEEGRFEDIRECIGCNVCIGTVWGVGSRLICTQNATAGEEYRRGWHPERFVTTRRPDRAALIIGAGPAGLECARVLGEQGLSNIHLVDAAPTIGGSANWISTLPGLGEWRRVVDWRQTQISKLRNVQIILNTSMSIEDARDYGADLIICANGSSWSRSGVNAVTRTAIPGATDFAGRVYVPEDILRDAATISGETVVIYDCDGYFMGVSLAELLAAQGKDVTVVTPEAEAGSFLRHTGEYEPVHRRLHELGVSVLTGMTLNSIGQDAVALTHTMTSAIREISADAVVLVTQRVPHSELYRALGSDPVVLAETGVSAVYRVGDCVVPRKIADAVFDGHRLAREIDSANPQIPLPFRRERLVVPNGPVI